MPTSFDMHVVIRSEDLGLWSASCTRCEQELAALVEQSAIPTLVAECIEHVCDSPS